MSAKQHSIRLFINVAGAFASRALNLLSAFIIVPLAVVGLGVKDYGVFAVILSAATFLNYADFGIGLAAVNPISASEAAKDHQRTREIVSDTWSLLIVMAVVVLVIGIVVIVGVRTVSPGQGGATFGWLVFVSCVALGLPAAFVQRVLFALERSYEANIWMSCARLLALGGVFCAYKTGAGLSGYVFAMVGLPALVGWGNTTYTFLVKRRDLRPEFRLSKAAAMRLLPEGLRYVVLQIGPYTETSFDIVLIGLSVGASSTTSYDLLTRLFFYVPALATVGGLPLWPAISAARARGDHRWVLQVQKLAIVLLTVGSIAAAVTLSVFYQQVIVLWTKHFVYFPQPVVTLVASSSVMAALSTLLATFLMGERQADFVFKVQVAVLFLLVLSKFALVPFWGIYALFGTNVVVLTLKVVLFSRRLSLFEVTR